MTKKILDLAGLQRYDTKLKDYVAEEVNKCGLDPIPSADVEKLFNSTEDVHFYISTSEYLRDETGDIDYETEYPVYTQEFTGTWPEQFTDTINNITYTLRRSEYYLEYVGKYNQSYLMYNPNYDEETEEPFVFPDMVIVDGTYYSMVID